jgi:hypothetical protein
MMPCARSPAPSRRLVHRNFSEGGSAARRRNLTPKHPKTRPLASSSYDASSVKTRPTAKNRRYDASVVSKPPIRSYDANVAIGRKPATYDASAARTLTTQVYDPSAAIRSKITMAMQPHPKKPYDPNLMKSTMSKKFATIKFVLPSTSTTLDKVQVLVL